MASSTDSAQHARDLEITEVNSLDPARVGEIRRIAAEAESSDGVAPLGEQPMLALERPAPGVAHVLALVDGVLAGYAQAADSDDGQVVEFVVAPEFRGRGIATALVDWMLRRHPRMTFWAHGDRPEAAAIAASHSMVRVRELLVMTRHRGDGPDVSEYGARSDSGDAGGTKGDAGGHDRGDGITVLDLNEAYSRYGADVVDSAVLRVNNAAFSWHPEQGGWSLETLRERMSVDWFDPAGFFVALEPGEPLRLLGFHWTKNVPVADGDEPLGEVYVVGVDPSAQGRGLGRRLTAVGIAYLEGRGIDEVELYVEGDNASALRAYEKLGFRTTKRDVMYGTEGE